MFNQWPASGSILLVGDFVFSDHDQKHKMGIEKQALDFARTILSDSPKSEKLFDSATHSDFRYIHPEGDSQWIKVDQIRELIQWSTGKPQISNKKVAILAPAHAMNIQAANAFLKTLEEPSLQTLFILVSDKPTFIPATIRSRCYWIRVRENYNQNATDSVLKQMIGKDLLALESKESDPVSIGNRWIKENPKRVLHWLAVILSEKINKAGREGKIVKDRKWWNFVDRVLEAKRSLEEPNQPNIQLLIESLLIEYDAVNPINTSLKLMLTFQ